MDYNNPNTVKFEDGLELNGFNWKWDYTSYQNGSNNTDITILMELPSGGIKYSRNFQISKPGVWEEIELYKELLKLPEFMGSNPI